MNKRTRKMTMTALMTALTIAAMYISTVFPTGQLGIIAVASLFCVAAVVEAGLGAGVFVFIGSSVLGMLLLPNKAMALLYIAFFGYYPIIKSLLERLPSRILEWALKLAVFNAAISIVWFLLKDLIFAEGVWSHGTWLIYLAGNAVFVLYDIGLTRLIAFYIAAISRKINR